MVLSEQREAEAFVGDGGGCLCVDDEAEGVFHLVVALEDAEGVGPVDEEIGGRVGEEFCGEFVLVDGGLVFAGE